MARSAGMVASNLVIGLLPIVCLIGCSNQSSPVRDQSRGGDRHLQPQGDSYVTVPVFYATDRLPARQPRPNLRLNMLLGLVAVMLTGLAVMIAVVRKRIALTSTALAWTALMGGVVAIVIIGLVGQVTRSAKHAVRYSDSRGVLVRGLSEVTVPASHQPGRVERPSMLRLEFRERQDRHIVMTRVTELSEIEFRSRLSHSIQKSDDRDLLLFIHGYNVDFESAIRRTAQLSVDLPFTGTPVCYSWPSVGKLSGYTVDQNNADWTAPHLRQFLLGLIAESGADAVHVVAHSMGNRAFLSAIEPLQWKTPYLKSPALGRVVLAAPDVDADRFRRDYAPAIGRLAQQVVLYASSDDRALVASRAIHGYARAGHSGADLVVVPGLETVDVSGIDLSLLGHSYYGDNPMILQELSEVLQMGLRANERKLLLPQGQAPNLFWRLSAHLLTQADAPHP